MYKIEPEIFAVWMKILKRVSKSVLWLLRFPAMAEQNIRAEAKAHGIGPRRIIFSDVVPRDDHLKRTYLADMCLDTPMFNGQHTSCDSLWGGTPVLTLGVEKMVSRVGSSIVHAAGTPEMIVKNLEEYEELAVKLAKDYFALDNCMMLLMLRRRSVAGWVMISGKAHLAAGSA